MGQSLPQVLEKIGQGKVFKCCGGEIITAETVQRWIENAISKSIYYHECLEAVGDVEYSQENIKVGYTAELTTWGRCKVTGTGRVNLTYRILEGGAAGMSGKAAYSEIKRMISHQIRTPDKMRIEMIASGGTVSFDIPVMKARRYGIEEMSDKMLENIAQKFKHVKIVENTKKIKYFQ